MSHRYFFFFSKEQQIDWQTLVVGNLFCPRPVKNVTCLRGKEEEEGEEGDGKQTDRQTLAR